MTWYVSVDQHAISLNVHNGEDRAPILVQEGVRGTPEFARSVRFPGPTEIRYQKSRPILANGAHVVVVSSERPEFVAEPGTVLRPVCEVADD